MVEAQLMLMSLHLLLEAPWSCCFILLLQEGLWCRHRGSGNCDSSCGSGCVARHRQGIVVAEGHSSRDLLRCLLLLVECAVGATAAAACAFACDRAAV